MGMGYCANYADVISWETLQQLCPQATSVISQALDEHGVTLDEFIRFWEREEAEDLPEGLKPEALLGMFDQLDKEFQQATQADNSTLELCPIFHDPDSGDRYDDVRGGFFHVDGAYELSPAGWKIGTKIQRKFFVCFG